MAEKKTLSKIDLGVALFAMAELGVKRIEIRYEGGGDSGAIEEILVYDKDKHGMKTDLIPRWDEIVETLEEWGYKRLEDVEGDWINNEGGYGTFYIEVPSGDYTISHTLRTFVEYDHEGTIKDELEE